MRHPVRVLVGSCCLGLLMMTLITLLATPGPAQDDAAAAEPAPPADQTYIGATKCASCHFTQFLKWKKNKHAEAFNQLPAKYKTDATCLKCHTTGFGEETGFKTASDKGLAGITCESCHGPGSKHAEVCASLPKSNLSEAQEKQARDSIWMMLPQNVCVTCHSPQGHKDHPPYDK